VDADRPGKALVATVLLAVWVALVLVISVGIDSKPIGVGLIAAVSLAFLAGYQSWRDRPV
jgi:hypothetical protein